MRHQRRSPKSPRIVVGEALLQVGRDADIALTDDRFAFARDERSALGQPFYAKASEGILLREQRRSKSCETRSAEQDGGPGRTRTCDNTVMSGAF
jgi:hypothetical protein